MPDTLRTVWFSGALLGVRCSACDNRAVLSAAGLPTIRRGNMTRLRDLKLRCGHCGVRGQSPEQFALYMPDGDDQADRFMRGNEVRAARVPADRLEWTRRRTRCHTTAVRTSFPRIHLSHVEL